MSKLIDYQKGAILAIENAKNHLNIAILSKEVCFGIANSHLILASEEAIKAMQLFKLSLNVDWQDFIESKKIFSSHKHKHEISYENHLMNSLIDNLFAKFVAFEKRVRDKNYSKEDIKKIQDRFISKMDFCQSLENIADEILAKDTTKDWWLKANGRKNLGFYVSKNETEDDWNGPFEFTESDFNESMTIVANFINEVEQQIDEK